MSEQHNHSHEHHHEHQHLDEHTSKEELVVLMKYMVAHNESHANQLADIATKVQDLSDGAYKDLQEAVTLANQANKKISEALEKLGK